MILQGIPASPGYAITNSAFFKKQSFNIKAVTKEPKGEIKNFNSALKRASERILKLKTDSQKKLGAEISEVFEAHLQILNDPVLKEQIVNMINDQKVNVEFAVQTIFKQFADLLRSNLEDTYMMERADDIDDVSQTLLEEILNPNSGENKNLNFTTQIVVADVLTPSDTASMNSKYIKGFITAEGGTTSHATIISRSLGIPAVVDLGEKINQIPNQELIIIDGILGQVIVNPTPDEIKSYQQKLDNYLVELKKLQSLINKKSLTKDGHLINIEGNIGSLQDAQLVYKNGGQGIGLFRTEFLFMNNDHWPTEEEQFLVYKKIISLEPEKEVIIRTLDIGGDKTLSYYQFPPESNPFLGYRSIRVSLDQPKIFKMQLKALIRAAYFGKIGIMFPMIATVQEFVDAKAIFNQCYDELKVEKKQIPPKKAIKVGMMVEVPAAAISLELFVHHADFFSVGTNDLIQYTMAADRMSEKVRYLYQPKNPALLWLLKHIIKIANTHNKRIAVCGELASDLEMTEILIGFGLKYFSVSPNSILPLQQKISEISLAEAQKS